MTNPTRERILAKAEELILQQGFGNTSIEQIIDAAAITKSGFFYHFNGKADLAHALVLRYLANDAQVFANLWTRADSLSDDPLQQLLIFLKLFSETMAELEQAHPGCLVVTFTYENFQMEQAFGDLLRNGVRDWRAMMLARLHKVLTRYSSPENTDLEMLADLFTTTVEGSIVLSRLFKSNRYLEQHLLAYRHYLQLLFKN